MSREAFQFIIVMTICYYYYYYLFVYYYYHSYSSYCYYCCAHACRWQQGRLLWREFGTWPLLLQQTVWSNLHIIVRKEVSRLGLVLSGKLKATQHRPIQSWWCHMQNCFCMLCACNICAENMNVWFLCGSSFRLTDDAESNSMLTHYTILSLHST